ncbi:DUF6783 domain-containing protein [Fusicatenibacter saccharivorans]|uniref:DUF6783 domain-containing protein n=1 Tax=Lachnospiraceae TaxID=186803 RepID=UPI003A1CF717
MKKAFRELRVPFSAQTVCSNRIRSKQIAKWGLQIVEMIFQILFLFYHPNCDCTMQIWFVFYSFPTITARSSSVVCISSSSNQML